MEKRLKCEKRFEISSVLVFLVSTLKSGKLPYKNPYFFPYLQFSLSPVFVRQSLDDLHDIVVGVGGEGVPAGVEADGRAPRHLEVKVHVSGLWLVELHVPVAVGGDHLGQLLRAELDLLEAGAIGRQGAGYGAGKGRIVR